MTTDRSAFPLIQLLALVNDIYSWEKAHEQL